MYRSSRGDDLDTRLLRANVLKGILEEITTANVNMVNADLLSDQRGLRIEETTVRSDGSAVLASMTVTIAASSTKFTGALDANGKISVSVSPMFPTHVMVPTCGGLFSVWQG
jgi:D-3-phosphoglycerate dehydrogenase / 2-oxoglutarate reductase